MSEELVAAKSQLTEVSNRMENVDIKGRQGLAELSDRIEVERLINDLVSYVADGIGTKKKKWNIDYNLYY